MQRAVWHDAEAELLKGAPKEARDISVRWPMIVSPFPHLLYNLQSATWTLQLCLALHCQTCLVAAFRLQPTTHSLQPAAFKAQRPVLRPAASSLQPAHPLTPTFTRSSCCSSTHNHPRWRLAASWSRRNTCAWAGCCGRINSHGSRWQRTRALTHRRGAVGHWSQQPPGSLSCLWDVGGLVCVVGSCWPV